MVVAVLVPDHLTFDEGQAAGTARPGPGPNLLLVGQLHGEVQPAHVAERAAEAPDDVGPVLGRDHLHRVHAHHAVEPLMKREVLEVELLGGDVGMLLAGTSEVGARVVHADHGPPALQHHPEVRAGPAGGVEHPAFGRELRQEPLDEGPVLLVDRTPTLVEHRGERVLLPLVLTTQLEDPGGPIRGRHCWRTASRSSSGSTLPRAARVPTPTRTSATPSHCTTERISEKSR